MKRRHFLNGLAATSFGLPVFANQIFLPSSNSNFTIGACDWSIGNRANLGAMEMASLIGLDGVQVSLGSLDDNMHLRKASVQKAYKQLCEIFDVSVTGIAIGALNQIPLKLDARTEQWVFDSIGVAKAMNVDVVLLAFFAANDLKNDSKGTQVVIDKLKAIMPEAEIQGITLGIESWLNAEEHMYIIDQVASPNLKIYYDTANSNKMGYDIYEEILWLGKKGQICEFHFKENGALLGQGLVDFQKVKNCIDEIGYVGPIQIEGAVPKGASILECHRQNVQFVRNLLNT